MITYIELKNFKSFRDTRFDFRRGKKSYKKFVAVYGENGSGKSNFVDSLSFLRLSLESFHRVALQQMQKAGSLPDALLASLANGYIPSFQNVMANHRMIACEEPTTIELGFIFNNHSGYYSISFTEGFIGEKLYYFTGKQNGVVFDLSLQDGRIGKSFCGNFFRAKDSERELTSLIDQYWGKHTLLSILNNEREIKNADYIKKSYLSFVYDVIDMILSLTAKHSINSFGSQITDVNDQGVMENPLEGLIDVAQENALNRTERILNTFFTQAYSDIKQVFYKKNPEGPNLHYRLYVDKMIGGQIRSINFQEESEGTKRILFMINDLLGACQGRTIALDEIDTGIHDLLLRTMLSSIDERITGQLIITTHNTYLLETLPPQSIYVIHVNHLGNKEVHCLGEYNIHGTNNIRSMYIKGLFGGVPVADEIEYGEIVEEIREAGAGQEKTE